MGGLNLMYGNRIDAATDSKAQSIGASHLKVAPTQAVG